MKTLADTLNAARAAIISAAPGIVERQAATALALVTLRVQNDGLAGANYTGKLVPKFFFANKAFNAGGRAYAKGKGKGSYPGFKAASGLKADAVTLTLTGRMFRSLTTLFIGFDGTVARAGIVASDAEEAAKVAWNMGRYGNFLEPDAAELATIQAQGQAELEAILKREFGE